MKKIVIDADEWIADMKAHKCRNISNPYADGRNDILDHYIEKLNNIVEESREYVRNGNLKRNK